MTLEQNNEQAIALSAFYGYLLDGIVFEDDEMYPLYRDEILKNRIYDT